MSSSTRFRLLTSSIALLAALPAAAQQIPSSNGATGRSTAALEEIIVTATRRSEPAQRIPIAVSVVGGERLREGNLNSVRDLANEIPALNFRMAASNKDHAIFVRGLSTVSTSPGVESSVSSVLDGVVLARQGQATLDLLDIERIEVLRGPQSTLFGKNASAGVLNIVSKKPGDEFRGFLDLTVAEGVEARVRGGVSSPIVADRLSAGITAMASHFGGNVRNVFDGEKVNGFDRYGVRNRWRFTPSEPRRDCRRLQLLRRWSHDEQNDEQVFA
jgi:iron complex outermembrane receptor protein